MAPDERAVKILLNAYWTPAGWRRQPALQPEDFAYAKAKGLMFDPVSLTHDDAVSMAISSREAVSQEQVVAAFVSSLSSRRLDLRSALGSYAVIRHLNSHRPIPNSSQCEICGASDRQDIDLNILNFERIKWGGVRHEQIAYVGFDLRQLARMGLIKPTQEDWDILRGILETARALPSDAKLPSLVRALSPILTSNGDERRMLISILGLCGILVDVTLPDFRRRFVPSHSRVRPSHGTNDWPYPVQWWTGACGVQEKAVADWFPGLEDRE
jgi:hypothetical protein